MLEAARNFCLMDSHEITSANEYMTALSLKTKTMNETGTFIKPKKNCYVALSRPTVKCEKTGSGVFFFFFLCQIWAKNLLKFVFNGLKKHLHDLYMRFDCILPEFSPFRNFKKNIGKLNSHGT